MREINTKAALKLARKQFIMRVHAILFLTWHNHDNASINDDKNGSLHKTNVLLGLCFAGDDTIGCWWSHNDQTIVMYQTG